MSILKDTGIFTGAKRPWTLSCLGAFWAAIAIFAPPGFCADSQDLQLSDSVREADTVVFGQIESTPYDQLDSLRTKPVAQALHGKATIPLSYSITVQRVIKGDSSLKSSKINMQSGEFAVPREVSGKQELQVGDGPRPGWYRDPQDHELGIFMLKKSEAGGFKSVSQFHPMLTLSGFDDQLQASSTADPVRCVEEQLIEFLARPSKNNRSEMSAFGRFVDFSYGYKQAAAALRHARYDRVKDRLRAVARDSRLTTLQNLLAIDVLFGLGDFSEQDLVVRLLLRPTELDDFAFNQCGNWSPLVDESAYASSFKSIHSWLLSKPDAVDAIAKGLQSANVKVRRKSACVLSELGTERVVGPLGAYGLSDQDPTVQVFACNGIARARGIRDTSTTNYQFNDGSVARFYKKWVSPPVRSTAPLVVSRLEDRLPAYHYTRELCEAGGQQIKETVERAELIVAGELLPLDGGIDFAKRFDPAKYRSLKVERVLKNTRNADLKGIVVSIDDGASTDKGIYFLNHQPDGTYSNPLGMYLFGLPARLSTGSLAVGVVGQHAEIERQLATEMVDILRTPLQSVIPGNRIEPGYQHRTQAVAFAIFPAAPQGRPVTVTMVPGAQGEPSVTSGTVAYTIKPRVPHPDCTPADAEYNQAASALRELPAATVVPLLKSALAAERLPALNKIWIADVLTAFGDITAIDDLMSYLTAHPPINEPEDCAVRALASQILMAAPGRQDKIAEADARARSACFIQLLRSERVAMRRAAARQLGSLVTVPATRRDAIIALSDIGLDDPDMEVRYECVMALESVADDVIGCYYCTPDEFAKDQASRVKRLRQWAAIFKAECSDATVPDGSQGMYLGQQGIVRVQSISDDSRLALFIFAGTFLLFGLIESICGLFGQATTYLLLPAPVASAKRVKIGLALIVFAIVFGAFINWATATSYLSELY